jgi:hypothetical protein
MNKQSRQELDDVTDLLQDTYDRMDLLISDIEDVIANVEKFQAGK